MNNNLNIRSARTNEIKKIQRFILKFFFKKNHILSRNARLLKWQYLNRTLSCSLAFVKSKIIGLHFFIPLSQFDVKLKSKKELFTSLWFTKKTKIIFLGKNIFDFTIKKENPKLVMAMGLPPYLIKFHKNKNFTIKKMKHFFMISPFKKKNVLNIKKKTNLNCVDLKIIEIKNIFQLKNLKISSLFKIQYPFKSIDYLKNRYLKHPIYKYRIYSIEHKKRKCLVVFRVVKFKSFNIIRIIDYIGFNSSLGNLKKFFISILKKYNADYLDFYFYGIKNIYLKKSGLHDKKKYRNLIIPNHFEPYENKNIDIVIAYLSSYKNSKKIRLFKGDSDIDRPNI